MKRRHFLQSSLAAAVTAALPTSQALAAALAAMSEVQGDVDAVTGAGAPVTLEQAALKELKGALRGRLLLPGFDGYDQARRVLNASIDRHPALIVQPTGAAELTHADSPLNADEARRAPASRRQRSVLRRRRRG